MTEQDKELAAISAVVGALTDLDEDGRIRVLDYVTKRFQIRHLIVAAPIDPPTVDHGGTLRQETPPVSHQPTDIRTLKEQKQPSGGIQMAVLVAYYLKSVASNEERKETISGADIVKYFNQAGYPLPTGKNGPTDTLNNARRAGYFESAGTGSFKLNSVGFNLAAYNMPTGSKKTALKQKMKRKPRKS